ncbi:MAG: hypothetical protein CM1200mP2_37800 [Planctomycetaceae bacterium]|nr:MAG: hypothetical protein CM1200mP2_37800 [Planctomycetaceae bacterium]
MESLVAEGSANLMIGHILLFNSEFRQIRSEASARVPFHIDCVRHPGPGSMSRILR